MSKEVQKNKVIGVDISIKPSGSEFSAKVTFNWLNGGKTEAKSPNKFQTIEDASFEAHECVKALLPDLESRLKGIGVDVQDPDHGDAEGVTPAKIPQKDPVKNGEYHAEFFGEVVTMACDCHKGEVHVKVFALEPESGEKAEIGSVKVENENEGKRRLEKITNDLACKFLEDLGISPDKAKKVTVKSGPEAEAMLAFAEAKSDQNQMH